MTAPALIECSPPQHQGAQAQIQHGLRAFADGLQHRLRCAEGDVHSPQISKAQIVEIPIQLRAVGLQAIADVSDGGGAKPRAGPK